MRSPSLTRHHCGRPHERKEARATLGSFRGRGTGHNFPQVSTCWRWFVDERITMLNIECGRYGSDPNDHLGGVHSGMCDSIAESVIGSGRIS